MTLYAVYSENLYLAQPGSTFDYRVTETWKNFPDYICVIEVTATVLENDGTDIVYSVEGTQYVRDGDAEETTPVELTFDTAEDYWGYNNGELALIEERTEWFDFQGDPVLYPQ